MKVDAYPLVYSGLQIRGLYRGTFRRYAAAIFLLLFQILRRRPAQSKTTGRGTRSRGRCKD
jgi:hypothetical protein